MKEHAAQMRRIRASLPRASTEEAHAQALRNAQQARIFFEEQRTANLRATLLRHAHTTPRAGLGILKISAE